MKKFEFKIDLDTRKFPPGLKAHEERAIEAAKKAFALLTDDLNLAEAARAADLLLIGLHQFDRFAELFGDAHRLREVGFQAGFLKVEVTHVANPGVTP